MIWCFSDDSSVYSKKSQRKQNPELPPLSPYDQPRSHSESSTSNKSSAIVTKDRRVTAPPAILGDSIDEGEEEDDDDPISRIMNRPTEEVVPRPVSAYVDLTQSYLPAGNRNSRDMSLHENPMKAQTKRDKAVTVHTTTNNNPEGIRYSPNRRPSPTDMKNLDDFRKGRTSKRATGKTQV